MTDARTEQQYYDAMYAGGSDYADVDALDWTRRRSILLRDTLRWLEAAGVAADQRVVELGCGTGWLRDVHPGWIGIDVSLTAFRQGRRVKAEWLRAPRARHIVADVQVLPLQSGSVDALFSWAAIEHVPSPELVLAEVARVLRPGGVAMIAPAWNVRSWAAKALPIRSYRSLSWRDRVVKASIPIRDLLLWRAAVAAPRRMWREWQIVRGKKVAFDYRRLTPNREAHIYTDDDAFSSMDAHAALAYFVSRGWKALSHPSCMKRLAARYQPVVVRRPERDC